MRKRSWLHYVGALLALSLVVGWGPSGCSTAERVKEAVSEAKPSSISQSTVYLQKLADAAEVLSTDLLEAREIHSSKARQVYTYAADLRRYLQLARDAERAGKAVAAREWLLAATEARLALEQFLKDNGRSLPANEEGGET